MKKRLLMKTFLWFLAFTVLFPVSSVFAAPQENDFEWKYHNFSFEKEKKEDTPKNSISKFLSSAKKKLGQSIAKVRESKKDPEESPVSLNYSSHEWMNQPGGHDRKKTRKISHSADVQNKIRGDSIKRLGMGTPVYCTLAGVVSHSGIAMGDKIVHLDGNGTVIRSSPQQFIDRFNGKNPAVNIYYAAYAPNRPVEIHFAAVRAFTSVGKKLKYNVFKKNCHGFTIWCFTGKYYSSTLSISQVEEYIEKQCGTKWNWRCWDGWR